MFLTDEPFLQSQLVSFENLGYFVKCRVYVKDVSYFSQIVFHLFVVIF